MAACTSFACSWVPVSATASVAARARWNVAGIEGARSRQTHLRRQDGQLVGARSTVLTHAPCMKITGRSQQKLRHKLRGNKWQRQWQHTQ